MSNILNVTEESLAADVYGASTTVLLDLWAPWCAPCRGLAPSLERLASLTSENLIIAKLDVEQYPDAMARFNVRGIPALLLFKDGKEVGRELGSKTLTQLKDWVMKFDVNVSERAPKALDAAKYGAFYGDGELKQFLCERLLRHAENGQVCSAREPFWLDGVGTPCAAWVHSADTTVFERLTGLQGSFLRAFDFARASTASALNPLLAALKPGTDLNLIPLQLIRQFMSATAFDWPLLLSAVPKIEALRNDWIRQADIYLDGDPARDLFLELSERVKNIEVPSDRAAALTRALIESLSPPPAAAESDEWIHIFNLAMSLCFPVAQHLSGWTLEDRQTEERRHVWFTQRLGLTADGRFTDEELAEYQRQWNQENDEYQRKEKAFFENDIQGLRPVTSVLQQQFIHIMNRAPAFT